MAAWVSNLLEWWVPTTCAVVCWSRQSSGRHLCATLVCDTCVRHLCATLSQVPYAKFYFCFLVDGVIRAALDENYAWAPPRLRPPPPTIHVKRSPRPRRRRGDKKSRPRQRGGRSGRRLRGAAAPVAPPAEPTTTSDDKKLTKLLERTHSVLMSPPSSSATGRSKEVPQGHSRAQHSMWVDEDEFATICAAQKAALASVEAVLATQTGESDESKVPPLLAADGFLLPGGAIVNIIQSTPDEERAEKARLALRAARHHRLQTSAVAVFADARAAVKAKFPSWRGNSVSDLQAATAQTHALSSWKKAHAAVLDGSKPGGFTSCWKQPRASIAKAGVYSLGHTLALGRIVARLKQTRGAEETKETVTSWEDWSDDAVVLDMRPGTVDSCVSVGVDAVVTSCSAAVRLAPRLVPVDLPRPRMPSILRISHELDELEFRLEDSVFCKLEVEGEALCNAAFEADWRASRLPGKWVFPDSTPEDKEQKQAAYEWLRANYTAMREAFKFFSCVKGGDVFNITWLGFTHFLEIWGVTGPRAGPNRCQLAVRFVCLAVSPASRAHMNMSDWCRTWTNCSLCATRSKCPTRTVTRLSRMICWSLDKLRRLAVPLCCSRWRVAAN